MDRQGLVELARCLKDTMNSDSWLMLLWKSIEVLKFAVIDLVFQPIVAK